MKAVTCSDFLRYLIPPMQSCLSLCAAWKTWYLCTREGASHIPHPGRLGASPAHLPASRGCATPILLALSQKWRAYSRRAHGTCFIFTFRGDAAVLIRHSHSVYTLCTVLSGMCGALGLSFARLVRGSKLQIGLYGERRASTHRCILVWLRYGPQLRCKVLTTVDSDSVAASLEIVLQF